MTESGQKNIYQRVFDFFCEAFSAREFCLFFKFIPYKAQLVDSLPGDSSPKRDIISRGIELLKEHGLFSDVRIWRKVCEMRPTLAPVVQQLSAEFGVRLNFGAAERSEHTIAPSPAVEPPSRPSGGPVLVKIQALQERVKAAQGRFDNGRTEHTLVEATALFVGQRLVPKELKGAANHAARHVSKHTKAHRISREMAHAKGLCGELELLVKSQDAIAYFGREQARSWIKHISKIATYQRPETRLRHLEVLLEQVAAHESRNT